ncbi:endo-1,4-beta-D-glucanase Y [Alteromonadaceae bacterium 2753L.S.0a.02]|nr:endo-1,4-beta-D-glucanase Y [Alteromonadaceae bacterium 2753L.S.0a.02]
MKYKFKSYKPIFGAITLLYFLVVQSAAFGEINPNPTFSSGNYRMVFTEKAIQPVYESALPVTPQMVDAKISEIYQQLFYSSDGANQRIVFDAVGSPAGLKFVKDIGSNDIRSEGMSYGMMIAVMMDDKAMFDSLWGFARAYMFPPTGNWYSWSLQDQAGYPVSEEAGASFKYGEGPAPDAEEFFAMALFFADHRWGSSSGTAIDNYQYWANNTLDILRSSNLWNGTMVKFTPSGNFTDPSYHVPAFYELFQRWASSNNSFWQTAASTSRGFLQNAADATTGLFPEYANQDGSPHAESYNELSPHSAFDSFRVIQNMAVDHYWMSKNTNMRNLVRGVMAFYNNLNDPDVLPNDFDFRYGAVYGLGQGLSGTGFYRTTSPNPNSFPVNANPWPNRATAPVPGLAAMNAVGALATDEEYVKYFVRYLWLQDTPTGTGRYYDGLLHLFGFLHLAGYYRIYTENEGSTLELSIDTGRLTDAGLPLIYWRDPTYFTAAGCPEGQTVTSYTYTMNFLTDGYPDIGPVDLTPLTNGRWLASIEPVHPSHDDFDIAVTRNCSLSGPRTEHITGFVDPSGFVKDTFGNAISGAKVVLWQTNTADENSALIQLPPDSTQMAPYNRSNPDYTSTTGNFGWDVAPQHWYKVVASYPGCVNPDDHDVFEVETPLMFVGPEITDLDMRLYCPYQGKLNVEVVPTMDWGDGYCANVTLTNTNSWTLDWLTSLQVEGKVYVFWNAEYHQSGDTVTIQGIEWNNELQPGETSSSIAFCADRTPSYNITVRARGTSGTERVRLTVGGQTVSEWTLSTSFQDYPFSTDLSGGINVQYVNDYGYYRDVVVDYVDIESVRHQAEDQTQYSGSASGTGDCATGYNDGWIHCDGYIGFSAYQ